MTLTEIIADLENQLAWRGPGDRPQGHIVMPRSEASELVDHIRAMREALWAISDPLQIPKEWPEVGMTRALKIIVELQKLAKTGLGLTPAPEHE